MIAPRDQVPARRKSLPETKLHLSSTLGLDVIDLMTEGLYQLSDEQAVSLAKAQNRVIITFDLDFGEIYHFRGPGQIGIIILRLEDQTVKSVNRILGRLFTTHAATIDLDRSLVVIDENKIGISRLRK